MKFGSIVTLLVVLAGAFAGCMSDPPTSPSPQPSLKRVHSGATIVDVAEQVRANFEVHVLPAVFPGHGLYEPTIDVAKDGTIYYTSHSQDVGRNPSPSYYSRDDGKASA